MAYPVKPDPAYDYTTFQTGSPTAPLPAVQVENDFAGLKTAVDATIDFITGSFGATGRLKPWQLPTAQDLEEYVDTASDAATAAALSASSASASATAAAAAFDQFDDRYLGAKASDPALDNDGNALAAGALYYNTGSNEMRQWDGADWLVLAAGISEASGDARYLQLIGGTLSGALALPNASPTLDNHAARKKYIDDLTALLFSTGDVKLTWKTTADSGWVMVNDGTIGDASSGATTRANADTSALFTLLWTNFADGQAAVSTGRGASAAADFAAHKTIALPKALGRVIGAAGAGSGLTSRTLGVTVGSETHTHTGTTEANGANITTASNSGQNTAPGSHTHTFTTDAGSSMPPTVFWNVMVKL